jgi:hypothetical protein
VQSVAKNQYIPVVFPFGNSGNGKPAGQPRWDVFKGVNGQVDAVFKQRIVEGFGEYTFTAKHGKRCVEYEVTLGFDEDKFGRMAQAAEQSGYMFGLPGSQNTVSRAYS